ncbi:adenylate/guanylate cyclase domain-containing protein [Dulcicalothrix desertica PCC 7102]|uniref:Adenylate/guanylate cyclase domain-containing protein n=1 Tax=Dulcicalothrix desertica PCC 7102 TaxID=232991 RepID=A0A433VNA9_9CYAN|nr:adenylate/guanylate cyclase domain-containing protein [Dulcicalothrix desertica]RUT07586.1 adenylate/guanylate cyclase domain-containing protein [Dulcicalothrix desertica PCC 7102]TWH39755.1 adenylate cyclase [Dulcicalothrix desertica PCC 7102]
MRAFKKRIWQLRGILLTAPAVAGLLIGLRYAGLLQPFELAALDEFFRRRPSEPVDERVVIVEVNEEDVRKHGLPISDTKLARMITNIKQQQPRAIGLDIYRDLPVEPGHQELINVYKTTPNLIGIQKVIGSSYGVAINPPPVLYELGQVSSNDFVPDPDGKIRRSLLSIKTKSDETVVGLGAQLALLYLEAENITLEMVDAADNKLKLGKATFTPFKANDGGYVHADLGGYQILSNFRNLKRGFRTISASEVLEGKIPPNFARNRIVLIGVTAESAGDYFFTPYSNGLFGSVVRRNSGVFIHADVTSQLISAALDGRPQIKFWADTKEWLWIIFWSITGSTVIWVRRYKNRSINFALTNILILTIGAAIIGSSYIAFLLGWWLPVVPGFLGLIGSAMVTTGYIARSTASMRHTFGRYLSDEVVTALLEAPSGLKLGGEMVQATLLISDLRGFSALSERVSPQKIVEIINLYLGTMTDVINQYKGTINDFMGDGIFVIFGAPVELEEHQEKAVACAIAMQLAMEPINKQLAEMNLPALGMGIGIHTGEVVAGNIGSKQRAKYTVMGSNVNLASRIETYTVGGQILISEDTLKAIKSPLQINEEMQVQPKGIKYPITIYEIGAISGKFNLTLNKLAEEFISLTQEIPCKYRIVEEKHLSEKIYYGSITKLSALNGAELRTKRPLSTLINIQIYLYIEDEQLAKQDIYAKVIKHLDSYQTTSHIRFTALPSEIAQYFTKQVQ